MCNATDRLAFSFIIQLLFPRSPACSSTKLLTRPVFLPVIGDSCLSPRNPSHFRFTKIQSLVSQKKNHKSILGKSIGISNFVSLPKIPKTSNFKIDRKGLHFYLFFLSNAIENYWSTNSRLLPFFFFEERVSPWIDKIARSCRLGPPEDGPRSMRGGRVLWGGGEKETERQLSHFQNRRVARARHSLGGHPCDLPEVHR